MMSNQLMMMDRRFRSKMSAAMETVRKTLDLTRTPKYAADVQDHSYDDKFGLPEFVVNSALAAQINALERMGLEKDKLQTLVDIVQKEKRSVTLRFVANETCEFIKEQDVDIESPTKISTRVTESTTETSGDAVATTEKQYEHKVITKVKEYHWKVGLAYKLFCYAGSDSESDQVVIQSREAFATIITTGNKQPPIQRSQLYPLDVSVTWLLENLSSLHCKFAIDRSQKTCRTPRRNEQVDAALEHFNNFASWSDKCRDCLCRAEREILGRHNPASSSGPIPQMRTAPVLSSVTSCGLFVPVLPLMEGPKDIDTNDSTEVNESVPSSNSEALVAKVEEASPLLSVGDVNRFLQEQCRTMDDATLSLAKAHPAGDKQDEFISVDEAKIVMLCMHLINISSQLKGSIEYIEEMLRDQLVAAIGKEVHPHDFEEFLRFHNQKLLGNAYTPKPFCYAIRRPDHYPDGVLSIEMDTKQDTNKFGPIETIVNKISGTTAPSMYFPINAATSVEFTGERYLHAWIQHRFASSPRGQPKLVARARQFSSFLLMVGIIAGSDKFDPKDAIILQNKDEVIIPLLLNELPTPKEFKDAISSLSPEQQRFAKSFRGMQLESSVFGVCVVQLKPQLEALLGLPTDALTKEIGLTQDLLSLFIDYQIPSDLLSFDGPQDAPVATKVDTVKEYVKKVQDVIQSAKTKQLEEEAQKADMRSEMQQSYDGAYWEKQGRQSLSRGRNRRGGGADGFVSGSLGTGVRQSALPTMAFGAPSVMAFGAPPAMPRAAPPPTTRHTYMAECSMGCAEPMPEYDEDGWDVDNCEDVFSQEALPGKEASTKESCKQPNHQDSQPHEGAVSSSGKLVDFTAMPKALNAAFDKHDQDNALRTTIIKTEKTWTRLRQENLLTKSEKKTLGEADLKTEKNKAFDLLDALSRSGALPIACAELHVVLGVTHCFENTVMNTVIQDNINPIEKMEKSTLLIASTIHGAPANELLKEGTTIREAAGLLTEA